MARVGTDNADRDRGFLTWRKLQARVAVKLVDYPLQAVAAASEQERRKAAFRGEFMRRVIVFFRRFLQDSEAATAVEYAVMLALVLLSVISAIAAVGGRAGGFWGGIQTNLNGVGFGGGS